MKKRVGITFGCFDLLHCGHCLMLAEAKRDCDFLIVGLQTDPTIDRPDTKNKPVQSLVERWLQLTSQKYVDQIVPYQTEAEIDEILRTMPIDVRYIGADYIGKDFTGKQTCEDMNIEIYYNSRDHEFSTSGLRERVLKASMKGKQHGRH